MRLENTAKKYLGVRGQSPAHKALVDYYNKYCYPYVYDNRKYKMTYYDDWCAMFCSVIAHMNNVKNFPYEVSVYYMVQRAKSQGQWKLTNPKVNDLIIYDWGNNATLDHVGIVTSVSGDTITVIEGNGGNEVIYRSINRYSPLIEGYISLNIPVENTPISPSKTDNIDDIARRVINGEYGTGQERINKLGGLYTQVQNRVNYLLEIDKIANDVLRNKYGTGEKRKQLLGNKYNDVQKRVNEILKQKKK